jgi:hypothetical protein
MQSFSLWSPVAVWWRFFNVSDCLRTFKSISKRLLWKTFKYWHSYFKHTMLCTVYLKEMLCMHIKRVNTPVSHFFTKHCSLASKPYIHLFLLYSMVQSSLVWMHRSKESLNVIDFIQRQNVNTLSNDGVNNFILRHSNTNIRPLMKNIYIHFITTKHSEYLWGRNKDMLLK